MNLDKLPKKPNIVFIITDQEREVMHWPEGWAEEGAGQWFEPGDNGDIVWRYRAWVEEMVKRVKSVKPSTVLGAGSEQ